MKIYIMQNIILKKIKCIIYLLCSTITSNSISTLLSKIYLKVAQFYCNKSIIKNIIRKI